MATAAAAVRDLSATVAAAQSASNEVRRAAESRLAQFKIDPSAWRQCCEFMQHTTDASVLWFCLSVIDEAVRCRWAALLPEERQYTRGFVLHFALESGAPAFVTNKAAQVCVHVAQHDWPRDCPEFLSHLTAVASSGMGAGWLKAYGVLGLLVEVVSSPSASSSAGGHLRLHSSRRAELRARLRAEVPALLALLQAPLEREMAGGGGDAGSSERCVALMRFLAQLTAWPAAAAEAPTVVPPAVLAATMGCARWRTSPCGGAALACLSGIIDRSCYPADSESYALGIASSVFAMLSELLSAAGGIAAASSEYRARFTAFLHSFISSLFVRAERAATFPTNEFLALLFRYTLEQPSAEGFLACLDLWALFVDILEERQLYAEYGARDDGVSSGAPGGGAARTDESAYSAGLHALAVELLKRVSFSTNSAALLRLDAAGGAQFEALVDKAVDTLARIAMLDALAPRVASELAPVFGALVDGLVARPAESVASAEQALAARDLDAMLRVLCSLVPFFAGKEAETFAVAAGFVEQLLAVAECCTERRLHTQGAVFRAVHVRVLSTLAVFGHWMARIQVREFSFACYSFVCSSILLPIRRVVLPSPLATLAACLALGEQPRPGGGSGAPPLVEPATFARLVERAARCGIASMEAAISPPPEAVLLAAAQLLSTLSGVVRPVCLLPSPVWGRFLADVHTLCRDAPKEVHVQTVTAAVKSLTLLPNGVSQRGAAAGWEARGAALNALIAPIAQRLVAVPQVPGLRERRTFLQSYVAARVQLCCSLLRAALAATRSAPSTAREALARSLAPALPAVSALLSLYIETALDGALPRAATRRSMAAATSLLALQAALFDCLPSQLGKGYNKRVAGALADALCARECALLRALLSARCAALGGDAVAAHFIRLVAVLADEPSHKFSGMLPSIVSLCTERIVPILRPCVSELVETTEALLALVRRLLMHHWDGVAALGAGEATLQLVDILAAVLRAEEAPPAAARSVVATLVEVDERHGLFAHALFKTRAAVPLLELLLRALVCGAHQSVRDEMVRAVHAIARVDFDAFFATVVPAFLAAFALAGGAQLSDASREALAAALAQATGVTTFAANLVRFVDDVQSLTMVEQR